MVEMFGLPFTDLGSVEPVADTVLDAVTAGGLGNRGNGRPSGQPAVLRSVVTPNVDIVVQLDQNPTPDVTDVYRRSQFVLPDGQPIVALSRLLGRPLTARLTGSDLFAALWPRVVDAGVRVLVVAANEELRHHFELAHPAAIVAVAPTLDPGSPDGFAGFVGELRRAGSLDDVRLVLLGIGHPRDAMLLAEIIATTPHGTEAPFVCCLGGSAEMYFGLRRRAPGWVQRWSLEWLYRLVQEPRRLAHRYLVRDRRFFVLALHELRTSRRVRTAT